MRKKVAALGAALMVVLATAAAALAITNGTPDGNRHPYVGLMVALDSDGVPLWRCSGSLLSPTVFLTAGHCVEDPAAHIEVWVSPGPVTTDPDYAAALANDPDGIVSCNDSPLFDGYPCQGDAGGTPHQNPDYCTSPCGNGLPTSPSATSASSPSMLASRSAATPTSLNPGRWTRWPNKTPVDFVGYGVQFQANIPGNQLPQPPPLPVDGSEGANVCPERIGLRQLQAQRRVPLNLLSTRAVGRAEPASVTPVAPTCSRDRHRPWG